MQADEIELPGIGEPEFLQRADPRAAGSPGRGRSLVRVEATGVSFAEQQMRRGKYYDQPKFPFVPGYDLVGIGEAPAQRVAALTKVGGWADHVVLDRADLVPVPDGVSAEAAETVVVNGAHGVADAAPRGEGPRGPDDRRPRARPAASAPCSSSSPATPASR